MVNPRRISRSVSKMTCIHDAYHHRRRTDTGHVTLGGDVVLGGIALGLQIFVGLLMFMGAFPLRAAASTRVMPRQKMNVLMVAARATGMSP